MFTHNQYLTYQILHKAGRQAGYILDHELDNCQGIVVYDNDSTNVIPRLKWKSVGKYHLTAICVTSWINYTYVITASFNRLELTLPSGGRHQFTHTSDAINAANDDLYERIQKINSTTHSVVKHNHPVLKWEKVYVEEPIVDGTKVVERAKFGVDGNTYVFNLEKYTWNKDYCIRVVAIGKKYNVRGRMGEIADRAKHAANNILKLILSGREMQSICFWELAVGWESYLSSPVAQFIPEVQNGKLVHPNQVIKKYAIDDDEAVLKNWKRICEHWSVSEIASFTTDDGSEYVFTISVKNLAGGYAAFTHLTIDKYTYEGYRVGRTLEDARYAANKLLKLVLDGRHPDTITSSELMEKSDEDQGENEC